MTLYRDGAQSYLDAVVAQTDALTAERRVLSLRVRRIQAGIGLIRAIGGGWSRADLPTEDDASTLARPAALTH